MQIYYATQTDIKPPTFVFFVSNSKGIHFSYERYLMNQIREKFEFDSVPLKLIFRKKVRGIPDFALNDIILSK